MTISSLAVAGENARMDSNRPRAGGPQRRRTFSPADKLAHLAAYEQACSTNDGGAYLRREGSPDIPGRFTYGLLLDVVKLYQLRSKAPFTP